jgi:hypothetical protein
MVARPRNLQQLNRDLKRMSVSVVARPRNQTKPLKTGCFQGLLAVEDLASNIARGSDRRKVAALTRRSCTMG